MIKAPIKSRSIRKITRFLRMILLCVIILCTLNSVLNITIVHGHSMDPTLSDGHLYMLVRNHYLPNNQVKRGDIVVAQTTFFGSVVKRVIGLPGDTLEIRDNQVYINGETLIEDYLYEPLETEDIPAFTLPEGACFIMGDNRNHSTDSRVFGCISEDDIYGILYLEHQSLLWIVFLIVQIIIAFSCTTGFLKEEKQWK